MAAMVSAALPPSVTAAIDVGKLASQQAAAIATGLAGAASAGPLAIAGATYQGLKVMGDLVRAWAELQAKDWRDQNASVIETVTQEVCTAAGGNIRAKYQPAESVTLERPRGYEGKGLKDKEWTCAKMRAQYKQGWVACLGRPFKSAVLYTPIPVLVASGGAFDVQKPASVYGPSGPGVYPSKDLIPEEWSEYRWWGVRAEYDVAQKWQWIARVIDSADANPAPPVRTFTTVAPGLGATWGPQGQTLPLGRYQAAYWGGLLIRPPGDLDEVALALRESQAYGLANAKRATEVLLWAREDMRRRGLAPGKPQGEAWRDPLYGKSAGGEGDGEKAGQGGSDGGGGGGILALMATVGILAMRKRGKRGR